MFIYDKKLNTKGENNMSKNTKHNKNIRARIFAIVGAILMVSGLIGSLICYL